MVSLHQEISRWCPLPPSHIDMGLYGIVKGGVGELFRLMNKKKVVFFSTFCCPPPGRGSYRHISSTPWQYPPHPSHQFLILPSNLDWENVVWWGKLVKWVRKRGMAEGGRALVRSGRDPLVRLGAAWRAGQRPGAGGRAGGAPRLSQIFLC